MFSVVASSEGGGWMAVVGIGNGSCLPHEGRRAHRPVALAAALALIGALSIVAPTSASAAVPPTATFNPNLLLKGSSSAGEPSIRTDRFGRSFVIAPTGVPAGCKAFRVAHDGSASSCLGFDDVYMTYHDVSVGDIQLGVSRDGGQTYVQNGPIINPLDVPEPQWQGGLNSPPGPAGNGIGNIVARRPVGGSLTLYSIF